MNDYSGYNNPTFELNEVEAESGKHENSEIQQNPQNEQSSYIVEEECLQNGKDEQILSEGKRLPGNTSSAPDQSEYNIDPIPVTVEDDNSLFSFFSKNERVQRSNEFYQKYKIKLKYASKLMTSLLALSAYIAYFIAVLIIKTDRENEDYWCNSDGLLIIMTSIAVIAVIYNMIIKSKRICRTIEAEIFLNEKIAKVKEKCSQMFNYRYTVPSIYIFVICCIAIFLLIDTVGERSRLISAMGILVFLLIGFLFSTAPRKVIWRHVIWGIGLQFIFGLFILRFPIGRRIFKCLGDKVHTFLAFTDRGTSFLFGPLVSEFSIFAFKVLCVVLFFGLFVQILYYYGVMQWIVLKLGWLLHVTIGTTACESVNAAANIFLGMSEAPLLIKPYLPLMTKSELHAVLTGGFATIAGSVLAAYISFGVNAAHLLSASVMSAPAALAFSKLFYPEVEKSRTCAKDIKIIKSSESNVLHAGLEGVTAAIPIVAAIGANLIAFISFIAFIDAILSWPCELVGLLEGTCTLSNIFGYLFTPVAWILGVPWADCYNVGQLIGTKTIVNEFVAYVKLGEFIQQSALSQRSVTIATYALCGFSNISSIGIQLGTIGAMAPERKSDLSQIVFRAMIAGTISCFLTACVAGALISSDTVTLHNSANL